MHNVQNVESITSFRIGQNSDWADKLFWQVQLRKQRRHSFYRTEYIMYKYMLDYV